MARPVNWRRNLFATTAVSFIGFTGFTLVMPFLPLYFQQLGLHDVGEIALWSGLSLGATPAITAVLAPFWGRLADRYGRKIMVERSLASFVVVMSAMAYVTRPWHVFALRAALGLFAGYGGLTLTMAAESAPPGRLATAIGFVQTAQRLGPALGPVIGGIVAQFVGIRRAFFVSAGFYAIALALVFALYRDPDVASGRPGAATDAITFRSLRAFENFLLLMFVIFAVQIVDRSFGPILPLFLTQIGAEAPDVALLAGIIFSEAALAGALGHHVTGKLLRRVSPRRLLVASTLVAAAGIIVYAAARSVTPLFITTPIFGLAVGVATTTAYTVAGGVIPQGAGGTGFGFLTSASLVGLAVSPMLAGLLGATSMRAVFVLDAVVLIGIAILVARVMSQRTASAPTAAPMPVEGDLQL
jgi:MFS family permease